MEIPFYIPHNDENRKLVHLLSSLYMKTVHYFHTKIYKTFPTTPNWQDCIHRIFGPPSIATFSITPMWNYLSFDNKWWWVPTRVLEQNSTGTKISMVSSDMACKYHVTWESVSTVFTGWKTGRFIIGSWQLEALH